MNSNLAAMGRGQDLLDAARKDDRITVEKIIAQLTKRSGPFPRYVDNFDVFHVICSRLSMGNIIVCLIMKSLYLIIGQSLWNTYTTQFILSTKMYCYPIDLACLRAYHYT